jgi:hypothetical protein
MFCCSISVLHLVSISEGLFNCNWNRSEGVATWKSHDVKRPGKANEEDKEKEEKKGVNIGLTTMT